MSGLFASLSAGRALEKISSFLRAFSAPPPVPSSSVQDDLEELRKLERTMHRIRATLHDAEEHWNIREETAKLRLKELKEVAYEMEDVVDEYEYEVNRCKAEALRRSACSAHYTGNGKRKHREENGAYPVDEVYQRTMETEGSLLILVDHGIQVLSCLRRASLGETN